MVIVTALKMKSEISSQAVMSRETWQVPPSSWAATRETQPRRTDRIVHNSGVVRVTSQINEPSKLENRSWAGEVFCQYFSFAHPCQRHVRLVRRPQPGLEPLSLLPGVPVQDAGASWATGRLRRFLPQRFNKYIHLQFAYLFVLSSITPFTLPCLRYLWWNTRRDTLKWVCYPTVSCVSPFVEIMIIMYTGT